MKRMRLKWLRTDRFTRLTSMKTQKHKKMNYKALRVGFYLLAILAMAAKAYRDGKKNKNR